MIPAAFDYVRAASLGQVIDLLQSDPDGTKLVAGGHTLIPTLKLRLASPSLLIDIGGLGELKGIDIAGDDIRIGALTRHAELLTSEKLNAKVPLFARAAQKIADPQVRNRGTIGGSLANADPSADWPAVVIALRAELEIVGPNGTRRVPADEFFLDIFYTSLEPSEVLTALILKAPVPGTRFAYRKIRHPASGYAVVGVAVAALLRDGRVADLSIGVTGAANHAFQGSLASDFLIGKPLSIENVTEAARLLAEDVECLSDGYASAQYRSSLLQTETKRALLEVTL